MRVKRLASRSRLQRFLPVVALVITTVATVAALLSASHFRKRDRTGQAIAVAQAMVSREVGEGVITTFCPREWTTVKPEADGEFIVSGWLEVVSRSGRAVTLSYTCDLIPDGGDWQAKKIELIPQ